MARPPYCTRRFLLIGSLPNHQTFPHNLISSGSRFSWIFSSCFYLLTKVLMHFITVFVLISFFNPISDGSCHGPAGPWTPKVVKAVTWKRSDTGVSNGYSTGAAITGDLKVKFRFQLFRISHYHLVFVRKWRSLIKRGGHVPLLSCKNYSHGSWFVSRLMRWVTHQVCVWRSDQASE